jgi:hypothetical protein
MLENLLTPENLLAFVTLTALEIVLGIDNIVFIAILSGKLPQEQQKQGPARRPHRRDGDADPPPLLRRMDRQV